MPRLPKWFFPGYRRKWHVRRALAGRKRIGEIESFLSAHKYSPATLQLLREEISALRELESDHLRRAESLHRRKKK